jgi:hypothetical protein
MADEFEALRQRLDYKREFWAEMLNKRETLK